MATDDGTEQAVAAGAALDRHDPNYDSEVRGYGVVWWGIVMGGCVCVCGAAQPPLRQREVHGFIHT